MHFADENEHHLTDQLSSGVYFYLESNIWIPSQSLWFVYLGIVLLDLFGVSRLSLLQTYDSPKHYYI